MLKGFRNVLDRYRNVLGAVVFVVLAPASAVAHPVEVPLTPANAWQFWSFEPGVILLLVASALSYAIGTARLWRTVGRGQGVRRFEVLVFAAGWLATVVALVSPVDALGGALFSAHMVQHELLMLVAAPLIALGAPHVAMLWSLPERVRRPLSRALVRDRSRVAAFLAAPATVWLLHALAIWSWHAPGLFDAAVRNDAVHAAQHLCFFGTAALFWFGLVRGRYGRLGYGAAVVYVFTTTVYTGLLGALLTVSPRPWYAVYASTTARFGLTPVEDQQLGGLIMWVPASIIYTAIGLALFAMWLKESERRADRAAVLHGMSIVILVATAATFAACGEDRYKVAAAMTGGDPGRGKQALATYGCVTCHTIPGIREADALVGPPLTRIASRVYLAGHLPNSPDNMIKWIRHPRDAEPHTAMPDTGVTESDARDIAAYLYTLR